MQSYLQLVAILGGVYRGVGLVRFLAPPWVGTAGLLEHPLGERPPALALCLLLHQGGQGQVCWENVCLRTGVADKPETSGDKTSRPHTVRKKKKEERGRVTSPANSVQLLMAERGHAVGWRLLMYKNRLNFEAA